MEARSGTTGAPPCGGIAGVWRTLNAWVRPILEGLARARAFGLAAEMAFFLFMSLIPLAAIFGLVAAKIAVHQQLAGRYLLASTPPAVRELVSREAAKLAAWNDGAVGWTAAATFVWLASGGIQSIFDAMEVQTQARRPWWRKRLYAMVSSVALPVGAAVVAALVIGIETIIGWAPGASTAGAAHPSGIARLVEAALGVAVALGMASALFWLGLAPAARRTMPVLPGAALAVFAHGLLGWGYGLVVTKLGDGGAYLGGLAVIGITLTSLYLSSLAVLVGVEVNKRLGGRAAHVLSSP